MKFTILSIFILIGCFLANHMVNGEVCKATLDESEKKYEKTNIRCTNRGKEECLYYERGSYYYCYVGGNYISDYCDECLDSVAEAPEKPEVSESTTTEGKAPETSTVATHYDVTEKHDVTDHPDYEEATETTEFYDETTETTERYDETTETTFETITDQTTEVSTVTDNTVSTETEKKDDDVTKKSDGVTEKSEEKPVKNTNNTQEATNSSEPAPESNTTIKTEDNEVNKTIVEENVVNKTLTENKNDVSSTVIKNSTKTNPEETTETEEENNENESETNPEITTNKEKENKENESENTTETKEENKDVVSENKPEITAKKEKENKDDKSETSTNEKPTNNQKEAGTNNFGLVAAIIGGAIFVIIIIVLVVKANAKKKEKQVYDLEMANVGEASSK